MDDKKLEELKNQLPDIQNGKDQRGVKIDWCGIEKYRVPIQTLTIDGDMQTTISSIDMMVDLESELKGVNMSRFVRVIEDTAEKNLVTGDMMEEMLKTCRDKLEAKNSYIVASFPYCVKKEAPVSKKVSHSTYDCNICGVLEEGQMRFYLEVNVPYTSLCPCSAEISQYSAHNQRSNATIRVRMKDYGEYIYIEEIVDIVESVASCPIWNSLKRPDEKYVTEKAYENPRFVEDMIREIALKLDEDERIEGYKIKVEHFESIHQHNAVARITKNIK